MSAYDKTKFYWLQLKEDFFDDDAISWLEEQQPKGKEYALFYLKLCLKSLKTNGILIKSDRDRYVYIFEQRYLDKIRDDKFSILDKIKELDPKQKVQFTLSIAISNEGKVDKDKYKSAQTAMNIVLGRGGDQAVIRQNDIYKFFGGRAQEVEKRTKVKARVVAHALENLIKESSKVMIMGHSNRSEERRVGKECRL